MVRAAHILLDQVLDMSVDERNTCRMCGGRRDVGPPACTETPTRSVAVGKAAHSFRPPHCHRAGNFGMRCALVAAFS